MKQIKGRYTEAFVYTDVVEQEALDQIKAMCDQPFAEGARVRVMPDVHYGASCTIGTTMTVGDKVVPNIVGVDIGCGMETVALEEREIDFSALDAAIRRHIPSGTSVRQTPHPAMADFDLTRLRCYEQISVQRAELSLGTLGGGNHFIEVDRSDAGRLYLVIHSGSRMLGTQVAQHYQKLGWAGLQAKGLDAEIPEAMAYVEGADMEDYLHDMHIVQQYAALNRQVMTRLLLDALGLHEAERFTTIHNYIDVERRILRKGAVSAQKDEILLIPINMRDGALLCRGKGNPEWNYSAPHGAGRLLSRSAARESLSVEEFRARMEGVYTTCVGRSTLDESPMAYKGIGDILDNIAPTAEVLEHLTPVFNFKSGS